MDELKTIAGGVELEVEYLDGRTERVKVRQIRPIERQRYLDCFNDDSASIELFCGKEKGWADTLTPESFDLVADKGQELNLPLFRNWYRRLKARSEAMNPGLLAKAEETALERSLNQVLPSGNSASPSPSGAA
jgi:hypothetical protein